MTKTTALRTSIDKASSRSRILNGQSKPQHGVTPVHPLLRLQRSIGNRAVARLIQAKLQRSESGDVCERKAEHAAVQVMRMVEPGRQNDASKIATEALAQRKATAHGAGVRTAPPIVDEVLASPGQPLDAATRTFFEPRFGHDSSALSAALSASSSYPSCDGHAYDPKKMCCINGKLVRQSPIEDLQDCPDRKQLVGRPNEYDGCSVPWFIRIGEDKDNPAGGRDTAFSDTSIHGIRPQAFVPVLPCDVHDKCYQTCNPDPVARELCDMKLIVDASRVCNNSTENEEVKTRCRKAVEKANYFLVRHGFGEESFEERQRQYCHCCPPPAHKDKKRQMVANTENVRLVKEPKYWANDDFLFARLPKGTTVEVLDKGAGEPFNQTALEYQWWWVRAEGKEGWVMQVLLDDVTGSP